jgi:hypothetical protein
LKYFFSDGLWLECCDYETRLGGGLSREKKRTAGLWSDQPQIAKSKCDDEEIVWPDDCDVAGRLRGDKQLLERAQSRNARRKNSAGTKDENVATREQVRFPVVRHVQERL